MPNKEIYELAHGIFKARPVNSLLLIAEAIEERIEYTKGATGVRQPLSKHGSKKPVFVRTMRM